MGVAVLMCVAAGCGSGGDPGDDAPSRGSTPKQPSSSAAAADPDAALSERCASQIPDPDAVSAVRLSGAGFDLQTAQFAPEGRATGSAVVLLPQTGASGLCGWGPFASMLAQRGVAAVAVDPCSVGDSECTAKGAEDLAGQIELIAARAKKQFGADRVYLVGASAGGSDTVAAVSDGVQVDGWADISGPSAWDRGPLLAMAPRLPPGGLVVQATSDGDDEYAAAERLAKAADARFLDGGSGHGYELVLDIDGSVLPAGEELMSYVGARRG